MLSDRKITIVVKTRADCHQTCANIFHEKSQKEKEKNNGKWVLYSLSQKSHHSRGIPEIRKFFL